MKQSVRRQAAKAVVAEMLKAGLTVTPEALIKATDLTVPEYVAFQAWAQNYTRTLAHEVGKELGIPVMAVGDGKGYKPIQTEEEAVEAKTRAEKQLKGQARRRKEIRRQLALQNQHTFKLEEVVTDAGAVDPTQLAQSAS